MVTAPRPTVSVEQRLRDVRRVDGWLLFASFALIFFGLLSLFSLDDGREMAQFPKQVLNVVLGLVPFALLVAVNPKVWLRYASVLYVANLGLLIMVLSMGKQLKGAQRWVEFGPIQFQPSEMAKLLVVLTLAAFFTMRQDSIHRLSTFVLSLVHVLVPLVLVLKQPHLGAALVLLVAWLAVCLVARVPMKFVGGAFGIATALVLVVFLVPSVSSAFLHEYQQSRVDSMRERIMGGVTDDQGSDYQIVRAQLAFGSGGVMGAGFLRGEQKRGGFIPDQHTDFIFTVVGEEFGLIGGAIVLGLFGLFFYRIWLVLLNATEPFSRMVVGGILAVLAFHAIVNIAMVLQLLPVVGLWLPFLSYGGTAMWLCMGCVALVLNIRMRERPLLF